MAAISGAELGRQLREAAWSVATLLVRLAEDSYVTWSDTVDAPTSAVMTGPTAESHLQAHHGLSSEEASVLLSAADASGTSDPAVPLEELLRTNRAGRDERRLSLDELLEEYR
jgi:hypothetical protein